MTDNTARPRGRFVQVRRRGKKLAERANEHPIGRAVRRFLDYNGNVLAGGIAYYSLASIASAVVLAVSIANYIVIGDEQNRERFFELVSELVPGVFEDGDGGAGLIDPDAVEATNLSGVVGLIALGTLVWAATRFMRGLRAGVHSMLGPAAGTSIPGTVRDVLVLIGLAVSAVVAVGMQVIGGALAGWMADLIGGEAASAVLVRVVAISAGVVANMLFAVLVFAVLGGARVQVRHMVIAVVVTALALAVLQQASSYFVTSAASNAVLAPFVPVIALLIFVDFTTRVLLGVAAWLGAVTVGDPDDPVEVLPAPGRRKHPTVTTAKAAGRTADDG